jgi:AcrR family transcriptional regulator
MEYVTLLIEEFCHYFQKAGITMGKIEVKKKQKKEDLLNTAFDLFTSKGLQETSISDIVKNAGVAKGTFYLYFKDKYDIRNLLVSRKSGQLFKNAVNSMREEGVSEFEDQIIYIANHIVDQLAQNKSLLMFVSKNLSWGVFKNALLSHHGDYDVDFHEVYQQILQGSKYELKDPEIMLFMIIELISSTTYSTILYEEPVTLEQLKPYLFENVRQIIRMHQKKEEEGEGIH